MTKQSFFIILTFLLGTFCSCDLSDDFEKLPGGHTFVREGSCYKYIMVNIKNSKDIPSSVAEYKFDKKFVTVLQIDSLECERVGVEKAASRNFYIIDVQNDLVLGPLTKAQFGEKFKQLSIEKSLFLQ